MALAAIKSSSSSRRALFCPAFVNLHFHLPFSSASNNSSSNSSLVDDFKVPVNVPEPELSSKNTAQFKKGPGGRASFSGNVVTVFGNSGFTGLRVVNRLAKHGNQLILPYRCDPYFVKEHKVVGELGQILYFPFNLGDEESIRKAVKYSNVVINLIGTFIDTPNFTIHDTNVEGARRIARICREMGVERLIHVSAMNADPEHRSKYIRNGQFLKTKGLGELAVRDEFPSATIVRPGLMYGEFDHFIHNMMSMARRMPVLGTVYIYKGGKGIYKMPTYVNDFTNAINRIAMDPAQAGKTFEFVGPYAYEMCELVDYMYNRAGCLPNAFPRYRYYRLRWPDPWFLFMTAGYVIFRKMYRSTRLYVNWEWLDFVEATSDVLSGGNTLGYQDLGIKPQEFENMGGFWCHTWSFANSQDYGYGEYPDPPLPLRSPILYKSKPRRETKKIHTEQRAFGLG